MSDQAMIIATFVISGISIAVNSVLIIRARRGAIEAKRRLGALEALEREDELARQRARAERRYGPQQQTMQEMRTP